MCITTNSYINVVLWTSNYRTCSGNVGPSRIRYRMNLEDYTEYKHKNFPATKKDARVPGETLLWYGKDQQEKDKTPEVMTLHLEQSRDWTDVDISYAWNSLGYRGPEPDYTANKKILLAGGSMLMGVGLPIEETLPVVLAKHFNADYLNLSDYDSLTEITAPLEQLGVDYDPDYVIIGDTRFVVENNWLMAFIKQKLKLHGVDIRKEDLQFFQQAFDNTNRSVLTVYNGFIQNLFPKAKVLFLIAPRKNFNFDTGFENQLTISKDYMVDLSRDNAHPGPNSIITIAKEIIRRLEDG